MYYTKYVHACRYLLAEAIEALLTLLTLLWRCREHTLVSVCVCVYFTDFTVALLHACISWQRRSRPTSEIRVNTFIIRIIRIMNPILLLYDDRQINPLLYTTLEIRVNTFTRQHIHYTYYTPQYFYYTYHRQTYYTPQYFYYIDKHIIRLNTFIIRLNTFIIRITDKHITGILAYNTYCGQVCL